MSGNRQAEKRASEEADMKAYWISFGRRLHRIRKEQGYTAERFAHQLGMSPTFIRQIECGAKRPSISTLITIARVLQVSVDELLDTKGSAQLFF